MQASYGGSVRTQTAAHWTKPQRTNAHWFFEKKMEREKTGQKLTDQVLYMSCRKLRAFHDTWHWIWCTKLNNHVGISPGIGAPVQILCVVHGWNICCRSLQLHPAVYYSHWAGYNSCVRSLWMVVFLYTFNKSYIATLSVTPFLFLNMSALKSSFNSIWHTLYQWVFVLFFILLVSFCLVSFFPVNFSLGICPVSFCPFYSY